MNTTLDDLLCEYLRCSPGLARAPTLRHRLNFLSRHVSIQLPVTTDHLNQLRVRALKAGKSAATIETAIGDVLTIMRHTNQPVPNRGRRLPAPPKNVEQPTLIDVGRAYQAADHAAWPIFTLPNRMRRDWTDDERQRLFRSFIFISFWTGLRIGDLIDIEWDNIFPDRIDWIASKTKVHHCFPVTPDVTRHLEMARGLDPQFVFPIAEGSVCYVREELARLCRIAGVEKFGPQMIRRASITNWYCTQQPKAGDIVHGSGVVQGITGFYAQGLRILTVAAETFVLPKEMQNPSVRGKNRAAIARLLLRIRSMPPHLIHQLARMAEVM